MQEGNEMISYRSWTTRFVLAASLAGAMLGSTVLPAPAAGTDPGTVVTHPITAAPVTAILPALSDVSVQPSGTQATITFTTASPATASVSVKPADVSEAATLHTTGAIAGRLPTAMESLTGPTAAPDYETAHTLHLSNLKSNTAYQATVTAQTKDGTQLSQQVTFSTAKERIRVTVDSIDITDGGQLIGDPSPLWLMGVQWGAGYTYRPTVNGQASTCFPTNGDRPVYSGGSKTGDVISEGLCQNGSYGDGTFQPTDTYGKPLSWVFAEENFDAMPTYLQVSASVDVSTGWDVIDGLNNLTAPSSVQSSNSWQVQQGVEYASKTLPVTATDGNFISSVTFKVELFYDNLSYTPSHNQPTNPWENR
jgi:hypothetical protein